MYLRKNAYSHLNSVYLLRGPTWHCQGPIINCQGRSWPSCSLWEKIQRCGLWAIQALLLSASRLHSLRGSSMTRRFGKVPQWAISCLYPQNSAPMATGSQGSPRAMVRNQWAGRRTGIGPPCIYVQDKVYCSRGPGPLEETDKAPVESCCYRYGWSDLALSSAKRS